MTRFRFYRLFFLYVLDRCPHCWGPLVWGQWNDGHLAGKPFCHNSGLSRGCPR